MNKFLKYLDCLLSETNLKINLSIVKKKKKTQGFVNKFFYLSFFFAFAQN